MFCSLDDWANESDVEQKLVWPMMTAPFPSGLALSTSDVLTKASIRRLEIGKGSSRKLYYPDHVVVIAGLPVLFWRPRPLGKTLARQWRRRACMRRS